LRCLVFTYCRGDPSRWRIRDIPDWYDPKKYPDAICGIDAVILRRQPGELSWRADDVFRCNIDDASEAIILQRFAEYVLGDAEADDLSVPTDVGDWTFLEERAHACKLDRRVFEAIEVIKDRQCPLELDYLQSMRQIWEDNELQGLVALNMIEDMDCLESNSPADVLEAGLRFLVQDSYGWVLTQSLRSLLAAFGCSLSEPQDEQLRRLSRMLREMTERANGLQAELDQRTREARGNATPQPAPF
jgi:hypothetical protein